MVSTYIYIIIMRVVSGVTKSKGPKNSSVHSDSSMVPHGSQQSDITLEKEGDATERRKEMLLSNCSSCPVRPVASTKNVFNLS